MLIGSLFAGIWMLECEHIYICNGSIYMQFVTNFKSFVLSASEQKLHNKLIVTIYSLVKLIYRWYECK